MDTQKAWSLYLDSRSQKYRNDLVVAYLPLVEKLARRMSKKLPSSVETEDLASCGVFGLMEAVSRYDPEHNVKFETFATVRIQGAMLDGLRKMDWAPRSARARARYLDEAQGELAHELGREPDMAELADRLGWDKEEIEAVLKEGSNTLVTLFLPYTETDGASVTLAETISTDYDEQNAMLEVSVLRDRLTSAITSLKDRERVVLVLYYFEDLKFTDIGNLLGVSESRVSQLHTDSVEKIRAALLG